MDEPEAEVLKPDEMSDQEFMDLCEEENIKQLRWLKEAIRKLYE